MSDKLIIAITIFFVTLVIKLAVDYRLWLKGKTNRHTVGPIIIFVVLVACSFLAGCKSIPMFFFGWWSLFDTFFGKLIGQGWLYVGETAWLDKLQRDYPPLIVLKHVLFIGAIIFFIYA